MMSIKPRKLATSLRRATVAGEVPVGIDGRTSRTTRKEKKAQYEEV